jgi:hypothetical protein|eukprot:COSAG02_NODE_3115_length_7335_cov_2.741017_4_plen_104_part_00
MFRDRQPYLTHSGHADGYPESDKHGTTGASILKQHDSITKNLFINGYNGVWTIGKCLHDLYWYPVMWLRTISIHPTSLIPCRLMGGLLASVDEDHDDGSQYCE